MAKHKYKKKSIFKDLHLTSTFSMSLVLFLVGLVTLLLFLARDISIYVRENINLSVILEDKIPDSYVKRIEKYISAAPFAKSHEYISKEQALKDHIASLGEDPQDFLGYNPLMASIEVKLNADYAHPDSVVMIEKKLSAFDHVNRIVYQKDLVSLVNENVKKISLVLLGLAAVLLIISLALINNTVRLAVYSNRFLINTMKLVGAKHWFIRRPYVLRGAFNGLLAAFLSLIYLAAMLYYVQYEFGLTSLLISVESALIVVLLVVLTGIFLTALSSFFAVGRYLRMKTNDMYFV